MILVIHKLSSMFRLFCVLLLVPYLAFSYLLLVSFGEFINAITRVLRSVVGYQSELGAKGR